MLRLLFTALLALLALMLPVHAFAQAGQVKITGSITSKDDLPLINTMVVNQRTFVGIGADIAGNFTITALRTDTLMISAYGHQVMKLCFRDSVNKPEYKVRIALKQLSVSLPSVSIEGEKSMKQVQKNIDQLGVKDTRMTHTVSDAITSPITFLYERFSKFEQTKRKVAEMENEDRKREVLKDLFRIYIRYDVIELDEEEFDQFIAYCNLSEEFIKSASEYELVTAIKARYDNFSKLGKSKQHSNTPASNGFKPKAKLSFEKISEGVYEMVVPDYDSLAETDNAFQDYYYSTESKPDCKLIVKNEYGKKVRECFYKDGKMGEEWWWYSTGEKEWYADWSFENKLKVYTRWYRNGQKQSEQDSTGIVYYWFDSGQLAKTMQPTGKSNCVQVKNWYHNGKLESEGSECDEKKTGLWKYYNEDGTLSKEENNP